ncbi:hypothetical protein P154DRAFT_517577 [Amniculicola lignicola CBS 123094]|uniref:Uncharacterized protein n=1 Tax=Amniculicola lignicola CBS 123094 TaxID=1392246 RepID=A0A6A5X2T8_9PLEO|nr:hypothetical protein P154DRAFT_517577 [Amniculicola lignicola CBS 123094]
MAASAIPDSGSKAVFKGFWTDADQGRLRGALLTLSNRNATALLSFLAVAVTFAASRSWKICRFAVYKLLHHRAGKQKLETKLDRRLKVLIRNVGTAGSALFELAEIAWTTRKEPRNSLWDWRPAALVFLSTVHLIGFLVAGILTSFVFRGRTVVSKAIPGCGQWFAPEPNDRAGRLTYVTMNLNLTMDTDNYVRNCYAQGVSRGILDCGKMFSRSLPHTVEHKVACPFNEDLCVIGKNGGFALDSGRVPFRSLGINSRYADQISIQRRSTCAVIKDEPFRAGILTSEDYPTLRDNQTARLYSYFHPENKNITFAYRDEIFSETYNLQAYHSPYKPEDTAEPLRPSTPDHDVSIIALRAAGIKFYQPYDDPWFSVQSEVNFNNDTGWMGEKDRRWTTSRFLNLLACDERTRFCSNVSNTCSPWTGLYAINQAFAAIPFLGGTAIRNGSDAYTHLTDIVVLVNLALPYTAIPNAIENRQGASALQASRWLNLGEQFHIEPEQWKLELDYWFSMSLARLQLELFNTIERPPGINTSLAYNLWEKNNLTDLCGLMKFHSTNHMTLSTVGIAVVVGVVGLLVLGSYLDVVLSWIPGSWGTWWRWTVMEGWESFSNERLLEEVEGWWMHRVECLGDPLEVTEEPKHHEDTGRV